LTKVIVSLCLLLFSLALYLVVINEDTVSFNNFTENHLEIVTTANEVSSYAKRAEGHLLLYLMLKNPIDRDKFFIRMDSLKIHIQRLILLQSNQDDKISVIQLLVKHENIIKTANSLLVSFDYSQNRQIEFNYISNIELIANFHSSTSSIRKIAVSMVKTSASQLRNKQNIIYDTLNIENIIIFFTVTACFFLLFVIMNMSKKMKLLNNTLYNYSYTDSLTKIKNRRAFDENFEIEWQRALRERSSLALLLIDVDSFKQVNDQHGHNVGDKCLIEIAQTLQSCLKRTTDILTRYGGEEFAIILPNTTEAMVVAEQCRQSVEQILHPINKKENLTITVGIGIFEVTNELKKEQVIVKVDQALYRGKEEGKNCVELAII